jgi:hypothetical protein
MYKHNKLEVKYVIMLINFISVVERTLSNQYTSHSQTDYNYLLNGHVSAEPHNVG